MQGLKPMETVTSTPGGVSILKLTMMYLTGHYTQGQFRPYSSQGRLVITQQVSYFFLSFQAELCNTIWQYNKPLFFL